MKQWKSYLAMALLLNCNAGVKAQTAIPHVIKPPQGSVLKLQAQARGEQIYQCVLSAGQYQWQLKAPDAALLDMQGRQIGRHFAGPTWEFQDGSSVTGKVVQKLDALQPNAIPWLLLETIQRRGTGLLADVRYINRLETEGGMPPAKRCDGNRLGEEKRVAYRAQYYFYTP